MIDIAINGLIDFTWVGYLVYTLVVTHISIVAITLYLHRGVCHSAIEINPFLSHFFRFWYNSIAYLLVSSRLGTENHLRHIPSKRLSRAFHILMLNPLQNSGHVALLNLGHIGLNAVQARLDLFPEVV